MTKQLESQLYHFANSEYLGALKAYLDELITENDLQARGIDPHKDPHRLSKTQGRTEGFLILKESLDALGELQDK